MNSIRCRNILALHAVFKSTCVNSGFIGVIGVLLEQWKDKPRQFLDEESFFFYNDKIAVSLNGGWWIWHGGHNDCFWLIKKQFYSLIKRSISGVILLKKLSDT